MFGIDTRDLRASFVVVLVALPFCAGVAAASGLGIERGVMTAIIGGLIAGRLGGAPLQINGPAVSMGVVLQALVAHYGAESLGPTVLLAGLLQAAASLLPRGGRLGFMSPPLVAGAVCVAGLTQWAAQVYGMAGAPATPMFLSNAFGLPRLLAANHLAPLAVAGLTLLVAGFWQNLARGWIRAVPGPVAGVAAGAILAWYCPGSVAMFHAPLFAPPALSGAGLISGVWAVLHDPSRLATAGLLAAMGAAESFAAASALSATTTARENRRELLAQGIGNMACGIAGALPMAGAIPRSFANAAAGASGPDANLLHAVWLALLCLLAPWALTWLPVPSLAALLALGGWRLACRCTREGASLRDRKAITQFTLTMIAGLAINLPAGIAAGALFGWAAAFSPRTPRRSSASVAQTA